MKVRILARDQQERRGYLPSFKDAFARSHGHEFTVECRVTTTSKASTKSQTLHKECNLQNSIDKIDFS